MPSNRIISIANSTENPSEKKEEDEEEEEQAEKEQEEEGGQIDPELKQYALQQTYLVLKKTGGIYFKVYFKFETNPSYISQYSCFYVRLLLLLLLVIIIIIKY